MSTKWNNGQKLQKTPGVCKKGPDPLDPTQEIFRYYPLQAEADWTEPGTPVEQAIAGMTTLEPDPIHLAHFGQIIATRLRLDLLLQWYDFTRSFTHTVTLYVDDVFHASVAVDFTDPTNALPFAAGLFTWYDATIPRTVHSKILS